VKDEEKTRHDIRSSLHTFWKWLVRRQEIRAEEMPAFPEVPFKSRRWDYYDLHTRDQLIRTVKELSEHKNPKIWIPFFFAAVYPKIRIGEWLKVMESSFNFDTGRVNLPASAAKERTPKHVAMDPDDLKMVKDLMAKYPAFGDAPFFRSVPGEEGVAPDVPFNYKRIEKWWKKAVNKLGVKWIPPYPSTKHTSAMGLRIEMGLSSDDIQKYGTGHLTKKALGRYLQGDDGEDRKVSRKLRRGIVVPFDGAAAHTELGS
jgi:hypothetical protein